MLTINFTQVRAKWVRAVETLFPHLSALGVGQNYAATTPVMPQNTGNIASGSSRGSKGRGRGRGSAQPSPSFTPTTALRGRAWHRTARCCWAARVPPRSAGVFRVQ